MNETGWLEKLLVQTPTVGVVLLLVWYFSKFMNDQRDTFLDYLRGRDSTFREAMNDLRDQLRELTDAIRGGDAKRVEKR